MESKPNAGKRTYALSVVFGALVAAALTVPRLFAGAGKGFDAAAGAALTFLAFFGMAGIVAVASFVLTLRDRRSLSLPARVAGLLPLPVTMAVVVALVMLVRSR